MPVVGWRFGALGRTFPRRPTLKRSPTQNHLFLGGHSMDFVPVQFQAFAEAPQKRFLGRIACGKTELQARVLPRTVRLSPTSLGRIRTP